MGRDGWKASVRGERKTLGPTQRMRKSRGKFREDASAAWDHPLELGGVVPRKDEERTSKFQPR